MLNFIAGLYVEIPTITEIIIHTIASTVPLVVVLAFRAFRVFIF